MNEPANDQRVRLWHDSSLSPGERARALLAEMTLPEKLAQLGSAWPGSAEISGDVAPMQDVFADGSSRSDGASEHGIGHLTRVFGTGPVSAAAGVDRLLALQREIVERTRLGIPALVHEECLTGFTTLGATVYPTALAWAATFDPALVERMSRAIGADMRAVGVHQGLAPVLDVVRDYRWGRVEETLGEDPYLAGILGAAYVRGLQDSGVVATLKHFAGYSASRAARNHAPVSIGPRELRDVILPPFEMAVREGGAGSVMNAYVDLDGVPAAANTALLTGILRQEWGFEGVVVSDYWAIAFLETMHRVADGTGAAGALALRAGIDVELPQTLCYGDELLKMVQEGEVSEELVDRSVLRLLRQKAEQGLLDAGWTPRAEPVDLDSPGNRAIARDIAERSVVLLANDGALPLAASASTIAVVGPCADDPLALMGCYSFPNHVLPRYPGLGIGVAASSFAEALRNELPGATIAVHPGCPISEVDRSGFGAAVAAARESDVCIAVVGDRAGMFGHGTSGEGCDAEDLNLPGVQGELVQALLATATPVVLVVISGRPYALGRYTGSAAMIQAFMPGEEGGGAIAGVVSGRITPSGRLPVQIPRSPGSVTTYLQPPLGGNSAGISNLDPAPLFPFGHGISYTAFAYSEAALSDSAIPTDGTVEVSVRVRNTGDRAGAETVQLYLHHTRAQVTRPVRELAGFTRVALAPGDSARVSFTLHADRTGFTGIDMHRIVEPGTIEIFVGRSATDLPCTVSVELTGPRRIIGHDRILVTPVRID
ncbi:glycoside hydrolase family 3 N-terminal domain-containing protein [Nocardia miyunensis]|uniref:glycoside hydrolase family 3 N-terminal domain-containing protein n=1 Tax=Nocardia miyunensis TaxID=282684 RepID=UPI000835A851|nr:glycoside hydrolase family 3 N-terminal domain-containing protein [Nocardia miyunensis]